MKRDYSRLALLVALVLLVLVISPFNFSGLLHHFHFDGLRRMLPLLLIAWLVMCLFGGGCCGKKCKKKGKKKHHKHEDHDDEAAAGDDD